MRKNSLGARPRIVEGFASLRRAPLVLVGVTLAACGPPSPRVTAPSARYVQEKGLPGQGTVAFVSRRTGPATLADAPFPSPFWEADGRRDLSGFPGAKVPFLSPYFSALEGREGFPRAAMVYFRLVGAGALAAVDAERTFRDPGAPVGLVEIDAGGRVARRVPVELKAFARATETVPAGLVSVAPRPGFVLAPRRLHVAYLRRSITSPALGTSDDLEHAKSTEPRADPLEEKTRLAHKPALDALEAAGVPRGDVAALAVFVTGSPEDGARTLFANVAREAPAVPLQGSVVMHQEGPGYVAVAGVYCTPNVQDAVEHAPYVQRGGTTSFQVTAGPSSPDCERRLHARFVLTLPTTPMPPGGYPFVVSAHGTMGDASDILGPQSFGAFAAKAGVAVVSTDQPLHGKHGDPAARPGVHGDVTIKIGPFSLPIAGLTPQLLFYNPLRPAASLGNMMQAVADAQMLGRSFRGLALPSFGLPPALAGVRLSSAPPMLAGHSQGSQSLAILGAIDPETPGVLLSGCGGEVRFGVLGNKEFARFRGTLEPLLGLERGELSREHPLLALAEWVAEPVDPLIYAPLYQAKGTHVLHVGGVGDSYNPDAAANALAVALAATPVAPSPQRMPDLGWLGLAEAPEVSGVRVLAYASFQPTRGEDGHFVLFREEPAMGMATRFFAQISRGERPVIRR